MALDRVNHRMFIPEPGNIRVLVYQLDARGRHVSSTVDHVLGHHSPLGRRRLSEVTERDVGAGGTLAYDDKYQRLFLGDGSFGGLPGTRILVFDTHPDRITDYPAAIHVIGQPDFTTRTPGFGRKKFGRGKLVVDSRNQRLFIRDGQNSRILVFDIHPDRLRDYPDAVAVIGQPDFTSREPGLGPKHIGRGGGGFGGGGMTLDPDQQRLFVSDPANNRILVFDVHPDRFQSYPSAIAVLGQPDFHTRSPRFAGVSALPEERWGFKNLTPGGLSYDSKHKRLFVSQLKENRVLVFDLSTEPLGKQPEAIAVLGQPNFTSFDPRVAKDRFAFPKDPVVDSEKQLLYVSEGFPGGNRVIAIDISPEKLRNGAAAVDVVGHLRDDGTNDYTRRAPNDRLDGRATTLARAVALDAIDHRLWVADEYNHRVLGFQLDSLNRLLDRRAHWVFGQRDFNTAAVSRSRTGMTIPLSVAYDEIDKRLYIADGWNDRVMIYDVDPRTLKPGGDQPAVVVLGQPDFLTQDPRAARNRFDFAVDGGRGIASSLLPMGIAFDQKRRRAFISDGGNNRILVFDIHKDRLQSGAGAIGVLGQSDYESKEARLSAAGLNSPGHLAYDADGDRLFVVDSFNERVLQFDVAPTLFKNGMPARYVLGQPDFTTTTRRRELARYATVPTPQSFPHPNGIAYDGLKKQLYVTDRGNDRVMVFDVAPEKMTNFPYARAILGQRSEESHAPQVVSNLSAQDQLYDPRGIALDSVNQQLYVTDSHWARLMVFNFPSDHRKVEVPSKGVRKFSALDPYVAEPWEMKRGYGRISGGADLGAAFVLTRTHFALDPVTEQQSRILISQSMGRAPTPQTRAIVFADGRNGSETHVFLANPGRTPVTIKLDLRMQLGRSKAIDKRLGAGEAITATVQQLMGVSPEMGALHVKARSPVVASAWSLASNRHGEEAVTLLPVVRGDPKNWPKIVPNLIFGGSYQADLILLNPHSAEARGTIAIHDEDGKKIEDVEYILDGGGAFVHRLTRKIAIPMSGYAVIHPRSSPVPAASGLIRQSDSGLVSLTRVDASGNTRFARVPLDSMPDPIRHGRATQVAFTIANPGGQGVSIRFILRDLDGREIDRFEQLLPPHLQRGFSLGTLFNRVQFAGSVTVSTDVPIAVSARMITTNLRGEAILTELPVLTDSHAEDSLVPYLDGDGNSTQFFVVSVGDRNVRTRIEFFSPAGESQEVILR